MNRPIPNTGLDLSQVSDQQKLIDMQRRTLALQLANVRGESLELTIAAAQQFDTFMATGS